MHTDTIYINFVFFVYAPTSNTPLWILCGLYFQPTPCAIDKKDKNNTYRKNIDIKDKNYLYRQKPDEGIVQTSELSTRPVFCLSRPIVTLAYPVCIYLRKLL